MTTLFNKATSKLSSIAKEDKGYDDKTFIKNIDYDELERRFQVHKYVPNYIHHYDYLTPQIRSMINDKPIYAQANQHVKQPPPRKKKIMEFDIVTGEVVSKEVEPRHEFKKELLSEQVQQRKELRKGHRDERSEFRKQHRNEADSERAEARRLLKDHMKQRRDFRNKTCLMEKKVGSKENRRPEQSFLFTDPFGSGQTTLVESRRHPEPNDSDRKNSLLTLHRPRNRKTSLSSTLKGLVLHKGHEGKNENLSLNRTLSYDQTKSNMTTKRDADKDRLKLSDSSGRRMSEVTRTYNFFLLNFHLMILEHFGLEMNPNCNSFKVHLNCSKIAFELPVGGHFTFRLVEGTSRSSAHVQRACVKYP